MACMSTSTSKEVVANYAHSLNPLILKVKSTSFRNCGSNISWLSLYPQEDEWLFPPFTFLKFVKDSKTPIKNTDGYMITVEPEFV